MNNTEEILKTLKEELKDFYGGRLQEIILYGSYARKEQTANSDIDLLIILDDFDNVYSEISRLSPLISEISLQYDILISYIPCRIKDFKAERELLYISAKTDGVIV